MSLGREVTQLVDYIIEVSNVGRSGPFSQDDLPASLGFIKTDPGFRLMMLFRFSNPYGKAGKLGSDSEHSI